MKTNHEIYIGDARSLDSIPENSVELVVTSPPYPMIEMWDDVFSSLDSHIEDALIKGDGWTAFELMHQILDSVWEEIARVLTDDGMLCLNIGDATRTLDDSFTLYPNHTEVTQRLQEHGFHPLPDIIWRKPANSAAKYMGSGMLPSNAYATLEHEHILLFRRGPSTRRFEPRSTNRYKSAFFWEERNQWFTDLWTDIRGVSQSLTAETNRERSAAYPLELPQRLINMFSIRGDTVLDPFWGTGTTSIAAMLSGRNSIGYEIDDGFKPVFADRISELPRVSEEYVEQRLTQHKEYIKNNDPDSFRYESNNYDTRVRTKQEKQIQFLIAEKIESKETSHEVTHKPYMP